MGDDDDDKDDNVRVVTDNQYTSHYVGIVRYLGTTKIEKKDVVTFLGLELMDPVGDCDGRRFDSTLGEHIRHFETKANYGAFVSISNVVKITPSNILSTLTDAIQKLNKHIVSLSHQNHSHLQQIAKQKQQIHSLVSHFCICYRSYIHVLCVLQI